jgi:pyruvate,water dikinase
VSLLAHEQRLVVGRLAARAVDTGLLHNASDYYQLDAGELDDVAAAPARLAAELRLRGYDHRALATFRPPVRVSGQVPPDAHWQREGSLPRCGPGEQLQGTAAGSGRAAGPITSLRSPAQVPALHPGDVLVVPTGSAVWIPLLPAAAALVVDAGWSMSPAAMAGRELGIPCVVGATDATARPAPGAHVDVDGDRGVVTVTDEPGRRHHPSARSGAA